MKKKLILLIEDDELDVISVKRSLKKLEVPHELATAYNGIEALSILQKINSNGESATTPDLILLDINMPKMNGLELLKELRKDSRFDAIKVFIMTTSREEQDRKMLEGLGITGYLVKPLNFNNNDKSTDSMDNFVLFQLRRILADDN
jgi:CheY-like chemotaxis protein